MALVIGDDRPNSLRGDIDPDDLSDDIFGRAGDDRLYGLTGHDALHGDDGDDLLDGGSGDDAMAGGSGNDRYVVDSLADTVVELSGIGSGVDIVSSSIGHTLGANLEHLFLTGVGNINGYGNALANLIVGNGGRNIIDGRGGADSLQGGLGDDLYRIDNAGVVVSENPGAGIDRVDSSIGHTLAANVETLKLVGSANISGTGNALRNLLIGNSGGNTLVGGIGADTMQGERGNDTYVVDSVGDRVIENVLAGSDRVFASISHTLQANVEHLNLTGAATISGHGNAAVNSITGNIGNNWIDGGAGADTMIGRAGNDTYVVDHADDVVIENAGGGFDKVAASVSETLTDVDVEKLVLTGAANLNGQGNAAANQIDGNSGVNILQGHAGDDWLKGGAGSDGLEGGDGNDMLWGGTGNDFLRGDAGADQFVFDSALNAATNVDRIQNANFLPGAVDHIRLANDVFSGLLPAPGGALRASQYFEGNSTGDGVFDAVGIYNHVLSGQLYYNSALGLGSALFAVIDTDGLPGGSAVLSWHHFLV